jgi:hypothetical protein
MNAQPAKKVAPDWTFDLDAEVEKLGGGKVVGFDFQGQVAEVELRGVNPPVDSEWETPPKLHGKE